MLSRAYARIASAISGAVVGTLGGVGIVVGTEAEGGLVIFLTGIVGGVVALVGEKFGEGAKEGK